MVNEKKAARKRRQQSEYRSGRDLDQLTGRAIRLALELAPSIADAASPKCADEVLDVALPTLDAAKFVRKRINDALGVGEWLDDVQAWVWQATSPRAALSERGRELGFELRLSRVL